MSNCYEHGWRNSQNSCPVCCPYTASSSVPDGLAGVGTRYLEGLKVENAELRKQLAESESERLEQARLLGMSGSREASLVARLAEVTKERDEALALNKNKSAQLVRFLQGRDVAEHALLDRIVEESFENEDLQKKLLAASAQEMVLRGALGRIVNGPDMSGLWGSARAHEALSTKPTELTAALMGMITAVRNVPDGWGLKTALDRVDAALGGK